MRALLCVLTQNQLRPSDPKHPEKSRYSHNNVTNEAILKKEQIYLIAPYSYIYYS